MAVGHRVPETQQWASISPWLTAVTLILHKKMCTLIMSHKYQVKWIFLLLMHLFFSYSISKNNPWNPPTLSVFWKITKKTKKLSSQLQTDDGKILHLTNCSTVAGLHLWGFFKVQLLHEWAKSQTETKNWALLGALLSQPQMNWVNLRLCFYWPTPNKTNRSFWCWLEEIWKELDFLKTAAQNLIFGRLLGTFLLKVEEMQVDSHLK